MSGEKDAKGLMEKASKKASSLSGAFSWFTGNGEKLEEAAELYTDAANKYKMDKLWMEAGDAFTKASECHIKLGEDLDALNKSVLAAGCYKKVEPERAVIPLKKALESYANKGRFHNAAKYAKELAEIYEENLQNQKLAVVYYQKAADWYQAEDANASANGCLLKMAAIYGSIEMYQEAIDAYESIAKTALASDLSKYSVKDHLFRAMLCSLCFSTLEESRALLANYEGMDPNFSSSREAQLLHEIIEDLDSENVESFTNHLSFFDRIMPIDGWKTALLLRIKRRFEEEPDLT